MSRRRITFLLHRISALVATTLAKRSLAGRLRAWPGLLTLALLLLLSASVGGMGGMSRWTGQSVEVAAQAVPTGPVATSRVTTNAPARATPLATRTRTATPVSTPTATYTATPIATRTPTRRPPTPTWTPFATVTATPYAAAAPFSPLATPNLTATSLITGTGTPTAVVPLPMARLGPHLAPGATLTNTLASAPMTGTATATATNALATSPAGELLMLIPTPTLIPTLAITEALALVLPVIRAPGLGEIVATVESATAAEENARGALPDAAPVATPGDALAETPVETPVPEGVVSEGAPTPGLHEPTPVIALTPDGTARSVRVPILMYHYLSAPPVDADIYRLDLSVAPELFAAHLDAIQRAGYTTISPYDLLTNLTQGAPLPEKPILLTFDDGYRDNYVNAFPLLRDRGMQATFFVITDFIDEQRPEYLTWDMVREMAAAGMSIEAHGRNHVSLQNQDQDYLVWQALGNFEAIERETGTRPRFIAYPAGDYDGLTVDIFRSANYWAGFTTIQGATHRSDDLFQLRRVRIRGTTTPEELLRLLVLDW